MCRINSNLLKYLLLSVTFYVGILSERALISKSAYLNNKQSKNIENEYGDYCGPIKIILELNGFNVPAILDTGAEVSIMSSSCAKRCHLFNQIDASHSGKARGVGFGDIIGRLDDITMRIGPLSFKSKISVLRDSNVDFLIGLDFLRRFKGNICLKENVLKLQIKENIVRIPLLTELSKFHDEIMYEKHDKFKEVNEEIENSSDQYDEFDDFSGTDYNDSVSMEGV